ncbi:MAG: hypothetical protein EPGJADBJ_04469 [Saprospiraceae bacterium]|nr:hypothetical protein [Saprospiraceae bacterium]
MSQRSDRHIMERWEAFRKNLQRETPAPVGESEFDQKKRIERLKGNFEAFCQYYFPNYASAPFAPFHLRFAKKVAKSDTIYIVRAWAREHAKSVAAGLFVPLFEMVNQRLHNMLLVSHSYDNACELLMPLMLNLESNQRFIHDFGQQKSWRGWEVGKFVTASGCSFRAIGAGQSPRGSRNEEKRPDFILVDDIDTDEEARNAVRLKKKWDWVEQALFPTLSISGRKRMIFVGNIIAKDGIIVRASKKADDFEQINILDAKGQPSWSGRYSLADVNYMLSKISYASGQKEYFNNPISEGTVFTDIRYGKVPPLNKFRFVVNYCDSSYKDSRKNDFKAIVQVGELNGTYYIIRCRLEQTVLNQMLTWFYDLTESAAQKTQVYNYVECNGFQDAWYQDVFMPALRQMEKTKGTLAVSPDDRDKPDKFSRIEGNLEPLNRRGSLIFNEDERNDPHMMRLEEQFKAIEPTLPAHDDGPDAAEGGVWIINTKLRRLAPIKVGQDKRTSKKY